MISGQPSRRVQSESNSLLGLKPVWRAPVILHVGSKDSRFEARRLRARRDLARPSPRARGRLPPEEDIERARASLLAQACDTCRAAIFALFVEVGEVGYVGRVAGSRSSRASSRTGGTQSRATMPVRFIGPFDDRHAPRQQRQRERGRRLRRRALALNTSGATLLNVTSTQAEAHRDHSSTGTTWRSSRSVGREQARSARSRAHRPRHARRSLNLLIKGGPGADTFTRRRVWLGPSPPAGLDTSAHIAAAIGTPRPLISPSTAFPEATRSRAGPYERPPRWGRQRRVPREHDGSRGVP